LKSNILIDEEDKINNGKMDDQLKLILLSGLIGAVTFSAGFYLSYKWANRQMETHKMSPERYKALYDNEIED